MAGTLCHRVAGDMIVFLLPNADGTTLIYRFSGNQPDVIWNVGVCGASPLAVYDFVKIVRLGCVSWLHTSDVRAALCRNALMAAADTYSFWR